MMKFKKEKVFFKYRQYKDLALFQVSLLIQSTMLSNRAEQPELVY